MLPKLTQYFSSSLLEEQINWILWLPVLFGLGIIFYFTNLPSPSYSAPLIIFSTAACLGILSRKELISLLPISITIFLAGFLWTKFYTEKIIVKPQIEHKIYATAIGRIDEITSFQNSLSGKNSQRIVLKNLNLYKAGSLKNDQFIKKEKIKKPKKKKKIKKKKEAKKRKPRKKKEIPNKDSNREIKAKLKKKPKPKKSKNNQKNVIKNYLGYPGYQEIDREILAQNYFYGDDKWHNNQYLTPPKKISLNIKSGIGSAKIGDLIMVRVFLEPFKKPNIIGGYDFGRDAYFKGIGGTGFTTSEIKILSSAKYSDFERDIKILRQKIAKKILDGIGDKDESDIIVALTVGYQNFISKDLMKDIRNSGLAHLLSISGLHLALATGIFFFLVRLILSTNQFLALNFDIKKISAAIAILAGFVYLLISGMPVPAVRSYLMVVIIFIAILIDRTSNSLRAIAFAALTILIYSPNSLLSVSFQLSFAAILSLITLYNLGKRLDSENKPLFMKIILYFLGIILSSLTAEIAIAPFTIYHFNSYSFYGIIANFFAIPITTFVVMPAVFLSLFLMPFGLEKIAFYGADFGVYLIIEIARKVSNFPHSYQIIKMISPTSFGVIIFSGLWFALWQKNWRYLGIIGVLIGIFMAYKTPLPNLLIDGERKYFAFYDKEIGLVFPKELKPSLYRNEWMKKMGENEFKSIPSLSETEKEKYQIFCDKNYCNFCLNNQQILILTERSRIDFICQTSADIIVNMTKKYSLPKCLKSSQKKIIDNKDLIEKGSHFLYLQDKKIKIRTI